MKIMITTTITPITFFVISRVITIVIIITIVILGHVCFFIIIISHVLYKAIRVTINISQCAIFHKEEVKKERKEGRMEGKRWGESERRRGRAVEEQRLINDGFLSPLCCDIFIFSLFPFLYVRLFDVSEVGWEGGGISV